MECKKGTFLFIALKRALIADLKRIGIYSSDLMLELRPYSKSYFGRYYIERRLIVLYVYRDKEQEKPFDYIDLLSTAVHEACHHLQWTDPNFLRKKNVMHDKEFWDLWNTYMSIYRDTVTDEDRRKRLDTIIEKGGRK